MNCKVELFLGAREPDEPIALRAYRSAVEHGNRDKQVLVYFENIRICANKIQKSATITAIKIVWMNITDLEDFALKDIQEKSMQRLPLCSKSAKQKM